MWLCEDFCELQKYTHSLTLIAYSKWGTEGGVTSGVVHVLSGSQGTPSIPQSPLGCCPQPLLNACTHAYKTHTHTHTHTRTVITIETWGTLGQEQQTSLSWTLLCLPPLTPIPLLWSLLPAKPILWHWAAHYTEQISQGYRLQKLLRKRESKVSSGCVWVRERAP